MNLRFVLLCGIGEPRNSEALDDIEQEAETETLCKEYISNYRKLATKTVYLQHEQHER